jgi:hypothetical protein
MRGPYVPNYALDLEELIAVWGGGRIAPIDDWRSLVSDRQRYVLGRDLDRVERLLRGVAIGKLDAVEDLRPLNAGHAIELWASWLGDRAEFISDGPWIADSDSDTDIDTLDWLERNGVEIDLGANRSPWDVAVPVENPIVRLIRRDELRRVHAQLVSVAREIPPPMRRAYAALRALHADRLFDDLDLVELNWT